MKNVIKAGGVAFLSYIIGMIQGSPLSSGEFSILFFVALIWLNQPAMIGDDDDEPTN